MKVSPRNSMKDETKNWLRVLRDKVVDLGTAF